MCTAWIVHDQLKLDGRVLVPTKDTRAAEEFGTRRTIFDDAATFLRAAQRYKKARKNLIEGGFNAATDYLVLVGAPELIAQATACCLELSGGNTVNALIWDRDTRRYVVREIIGKESQNG